MFLWECTLWQPIYERLPSGSPFMTAYPLTAHLWQPTLWLPQSATNILMTATLISNLQEMYYTGNEQLDSEVQKQVQDLLQTIK